MVKILKIGKLCAVVLILLIQLSWTTLNIARADEIRHPFTDLENTKLSEQLFVTDVEDRRIPEELNRFSKEQKARNIIHHSQRNHHTKKHKNVDDDWESLLLSPLEKKYPTSKLRQLYKRTVADSRNLLRSPVYNTPQSPKFELPQYQHFCDEDVPIGTQLLQVKAVSQINGENITYTLTDSNFTIDVNGNIKSASRLDADYNGALYTFNITAIGSNPDSPGSASVRIYTTNKNDESPVFSQEIYPARVDENAKANAVVTTIVATDKDGDKVKYSLNSFAPGIPPDMFVINPDSGVIRLGPTKFPFDKDSYELNVTATDDGSCCVDGDRNIHTGSAVVVVSIIDVNDHKPNFTDCGSYQPHIKENEPIGTSVIVVKATDEDRGENGRVDYFYVSKKEQLFTVDKSTGLVTTNKRFDREGDDGKFVPITITGRDNGSPATLEGVCLFKVIIEDVNDNKPMFDRAKYEEKLKQKTNVGADVFRLSATDDDADNNARIEYSLQASHKDPSALEYFEVDPDSGWVSLKKILGSKSIFEFTAKATDKGDTPLSNSVDVVIQIVDQKANPPTFDDSAKHPVIIKENFPQDTSILKLSASSGIAGDSRVTYKLIDGNTAQTNKRQNFLIFPEDDVSGKSMATLNIGKSLDYEDVKEYNLTVRAENSAGQSTEITVNIQVEDVNDEIPQFTDPAYLSVLEGKPIGSEVGQLHALDKDSTPPFNEVTFALEGVTPFAIDRKTGMITTNDVFDREKNQTILIRVKITDGAPSARINAKPGEHNSFFTDFHVHIGDINDNDPIFDKPLYEAEVSENEDNGHLVTTVQAFDQDQSSKLNYEITDGNIGGAFSIKAGTGAILVAGNLDYESSVKSYTLTVTVSDGLHEATTKVQIKVLDLNDNPPKFLQSTYDITIWERESQNTSGLPQLIVTVSVTDADESRPKDFVYFLTGQANEMGANGRSIFEINDSGQISLNAPLDRDLPNGRPTWRFNVFAQDEGGRMPGSLDGYAEVVVHLRDINDNAPSFPEPSYEGSVNENLPEGSSVMIMAAVDNDDPNEGNNAVLTYEIVKNVVEDGKNIFQIDPHTALITTNVGTLDRERIPEYVIEVVAKDGGGLTGTGTATISIGDVNDSPPRFEKSTYNITISETFGNIRPKDPILIIKVLDDDLPETNKNYFQIVPNSGPGFDRFNVVYHASSMSLMVTGVLDFENEEHRKGFNFQIKVSDMGPNPTDPNHIAICTVYITITDLNDNAPVFDVDRQNVSIKEDAPVGTSISKFHATDLDNFGRSKVSYAIEHSTNRQRQFKIDGDGTVILQRQLDREVTHRHELHILAIDDGAPSMTATATLIVNVLDVNDNAPQFKEDYRPVVPENVPPEIFVVEVEAYDPDDYAAGNGPPFKFALAETASQKIKDSFRLDFIVDGAGGEGSAKIYTKVEFDREEQKEYLIPIVIADSGKPPMSATNTLTVIIGDKNDNPMKDGSTDIFVYNYRGKAPEAAIGRVYVDDKDDWDLPDKKFHWQDGTEHSNFKLLEDSGTIIMKNGTRGGTYMLYFHVEDNFRNEQASATANVTVKEISEKAVYSSGSIRMSGITEEEFISVWDSKDNKEIKSKYAIMREKIAETTGANINNVDLFTVKKKGQLGIPILDIRFSAHGSPYYKPEKINGLLSISLSKIEKEVGVNITLIGIDECIYENVNCESSCSNELIATETPYVVNANRSSLAGVNSEVVAQCTCRARNFSHLENCGTIQCFNGGTCLTLLNGNAICHCPRGFDGPRCQKTMIGFENAGYAWFPPIQQCEESHLSLEFITKKADGLLFYNGPITDAKPGEILVKDFISMELTGGYPRLLIDFGSGTLELKVEGKRLDDEEWHTIDIFWAPEMVRLVVDFCEIGTKDDKEDSGEPPVFDRIGCEAMGTTPLFNEYLNVNSPLQIGGINHPELSYPAWDFKHTRIGFIGCIRNVILNGEFYDLGTPARHFNSQMGCPLTQEKCHDNDIMPLCGNGTCIASKSLVQCDCKAGFTGDRCELEAPQVSMDTNSYVKYSLTFEADKFRNGIMLRFRTYEQHGELFFAIGKDLKEYLMLKIHDGHLVYQFNLRTSGLVGNLWLSNVPVNDGQWHTVHIARYGSRASISLDGGEGRRFNETLHFEGLRQLIDVKSDEVFVGGHLVDTTLINDFKNSCISDVRFDSKFKQLPMPPVTIHNKYADAESVNVHGFCPEMESCETALCPDGMECANFMGLFVCNCLAGFVVGRDGKCVDYNECDDFPCQNGGICENTEGSFFCHCLEPHHGTYCNSITETQTVQLGSGALAAILICALLLLILALILVVYTRRQKTSQNQYVQDDPRENIINYDEEGGGEEDMNTYDLGPLRIQLDGMMGSPLGSKPGPEKPMKGLPLNRAYSPGSEPDVGDFINNNLGKANEDPDAVPTDDLRNYAYEGAGSTAGSLSSLASGTDDNEQDFDYLNNWGPRFQKLADMYGQGESEEE